MYPTTSSAAEELPFIFIIFLILFVMSYAVSSNLMFVAMGAFFTNIADERIGGTYVTLLNTVSNFGGTYPKFFIFYLVDLFTIRGCTSKNGNVVTWFTCDNCNALQGTCGKLIDGYYAIAIVCFIIGILLYQFVYKKTTRSLEEIPHDEWRVQLQHADIQNKEINSNQASVETP